MVEKNKEATYICINQETYCPESIKKQSYCLNTDIKTFLESLVQE